MKDRKMMLLGIWAVIAIIVIILFVILIVQQNTIEGAFTQSRSGYRNYDPKELCAANDCLYAGHISNLPASMGPARVDCYCEGELTTFQLPRSTADHAYFAYNY